MHCVKSKWSHHQILLGYTANCKAGTVRTCLEVLVEEVEEQQDGNEGWQGKGCCHPNQDDGAGQLQDAAQVES